MKDIYTPMPEIMRYKVRRWLGYDMSDTDEATLARYPHLEDWKPARLRGKPRPEQNNHQGGPDFCPSRYRKRGAKQDE